jgi:lipoprotein-releasing system ATP-binding protein
MRDRFEPHRRKRTMTTADKSSSPSSPISLEARDINKSYIDGSRRIEVLKGVNMQLSRGEMVAVVGASGTGKTTLLHILGTLDRPSGGSLYYNQEDLFAKDDAALSTFRNRTIGFVFQFHHLLPEFTALENVMMPGLIAGRARDELTDCARDILTRVGLEDRVGHKVGELSGGEQQRVALARAVVMKPTLLLADEPTGNLDTKTGLKVFRLLQEMSTVFSLTAVMVTHNMELAGEMDRCFTLADGTLHA